MVSSVALGLVAVVVLVLLLAGLWVFLDAPQHGMNPTKWAVITVVVPFFGFFAYLFEREEKTPSPEAEKRDEMFVDGPFEVHKSRADEVPWGCADDEDERDDDERE